VNTFVGSGKLKGLLPGDAPSVWIDTLDVREVQAGTYTLAVRVPNRMPSGKPVRFANATSDVVLGWLSLGDIQIR